MRIAVLTPVRLVGEGVAASLSLGAPSLDTRVVRDLEALRILARGEAPLDLVIVDVTQSIALDEIRAFHAEWPGLPLLALGLREQEAEVVAHGRAGFAGYLRRDDGREELAQKVDDALAGRLCCSPEIAAGIMRGLFRAGPRRGGCDLALLTRRETHVAQGIGRGLSNKEIARDLDISESTVKHHVHAILGKLGLTTRARLLRRFHDDPWMPRTTRGMHG
ncbi:MAG: response regulator transcription factor [Alphaproteobacteria bacterium]|nr:response regulator transcription factor [Alphaproteobacteria bacterium]